jgi:hypothetical protein
MARNVYCEVGTEFLNMHIIQENFRFQRVNQWLWEQWNRSRHNHQHWTFAITIHAPEYFGYFKLRVICRSPLISGERSPKRGEGERVGPNLKCLAAARKQKWQCTVTRNSRLCGPAEICKPHTEKHQPEWRFGKKLLQRNYVLIHTVSPCALHEQPILLPQGSMSKVLTIFSGLCHVAWFKKDFNETWCGRHATWITSKYKLEGGTNIWGWRETTAIESCGSHLFQFLK